MHHQSAKTGCWSAACFNFVLFLSSCILIGLVEGNEVAEVCENHVDVFLRPIRVPALYVGDSHHSIEEVCKIAIEQELKKRETATVNITDPLVTELFHDIEAVTSIANAVNETMAATNNAHVHTLFEQFKAELSHNISSLQSAITKIQKGVQNVTSSAECHRGYFGENCTACNNCSGRGMCHDGKKGSGRCSCFPGAYGRECENCRPGYFGPHCYACACKEGWSCNEGVDGTGCDSCSTSYFGPNCTACPSCGEHGSCNDTLSGDGQCVCEEGWTGAECNSCASSYFGAACTVCPACGQHGLCNDTLTGDGVCVCEEGWSGQACDSCSTLYFGPNCSSCPSCGEHGPCNDTLSGDGRCVCEEGWAGATCTSCAPLHYGSSCSPCPSCGDHGSCNDTLSGDGTCVCDDGWSGSACDSCSTSYFGPNCTACPSCGEYGSCNDTLSGDGQCICEPDWSGEECACLTGSHMLSCLSDSTIWSDVTSAAVFLVDPQAYYFEELGLGPSLSSDGLVLSAGGRSSDMSAGLVLVWERDNSSVSFFNSIPIKLTRPDGGDGYFSWYGTTLSSDGLLLAVDYSSGILVWERPLRSTSFADVTPSLLSLAAGYLTYTAVSSDRLVLATTGQSGSWPDSRNDFLAIFQRSSTSISFADVEGSVVKYLGTIGGRVSMSADGLVVAIGAPYVSSYQGWLMVFERSSLEVSFADVSPYWLANPSPWYQDFFGYPSFSSDGLTLVGGSAHWRYTQGCMVVWQRQSRNVSFADVTPVLLTDPHAQNDDALQLPALSSDGLVLAGTTPNYDGANSNCGAALVWRRSSTSVSFADVVPTKLVNPECDDGDTFGRGGVAVSANGEVLAVGSQYDDPKSLGQEGSVAVWENICEEGYSPPLCID